MSSIHEQANPTERPVCNSLENFGEVFQRFLRRENLDEWSIVLGAER